MKEKNNMPTSMDEIREAGYISEDRIREYAEDVMEGYCKEIVLGVRGVEVCDDKGNALYDVHEKIILRVPARMPVREVAELVKQIEPDSTEERRHRLVERLLNAYDRWDTEEALIQRIVRD
jgi:hypothetical protein